MSPFVHSKKQQAHSILLEISQPFTLVSEHERLKQRVLHLEQFILRSGGVGGAAPDDAAFLSFQTQLHRQEQLNEKFQQRPDLQGDQLESPYMEDELPDSDTEDAALVSLTLGEGVFLG